MKPSGPLTLEEKELIATMSAQGRTPNYIGKALARDRKTIVAALEKPETAELVEAKRVELADLFEDMSRRMMSSISEEDIVKLSAYQRVISSGVCIDKMRLLRDQSTSNVSLLSRLIDEAPDLPE